MALVRKIRADEDHVNIYILDAEIYRPQGGSDNIVRAQFIIKFEDNKLQFGTIVGGSPEGIDLYSLGEKIEMLPIEHPSCSHLIREEMNIPRITIG